MKKLGLFLFVGVLCLLLTGCGSTLGGHSNTTGLSSYTGSEVDMTCTNETTGENGNVITTTVDLLFDSNGYQMEQYGKMTVKFPSTVTDENYKKVLDQINSTTCFTSDCSGSHLELGLSSLGSDTVVDRNSDTIVITYHNMYGLGYEATQSDKDEARSQYVSEGFTCN